MIANQKIKIKPLPLMNPDDTDLKSGDRTSEHRGIKNKALKHRGREEAEEIGRRWEFSNSVQRFRSL